MLIPDRRGTSDGDEQMVNNHPGVPTQVDNLYAKRLRFFFNQTSQKPCASDVAAHLFRTKDVSDTGLTTLTVARITDFLVHSIRVVPHVFDIGRLPEYGGNGKW